MRQQFGGIANGTLRAAYVIIQRQQYIMWGFTLPPSHMTQTGKDLFINTVVYLMNQ